MLIGELSKKAQLSRDTIRFYEKKGLIKAKPSASEYNTYKNYTEENLQRILLIKKAKRQTAMSAISPTICVMCLICRVYHSALSSKQVRTPTPKILNE